MSGPANSESPGRGSQQSGLLRIRPMLAQSGPMPGDQSKWGFEFKWDGVRAIAHGCHGLLRLDSRNLADITSRYPELAGLPAALAPWEPVVLDGEIVALDSRGLPSFQLLQRRMHLASPAKVAAVASKSPAVFMVFDVLRLQGRSTMDLPYLHRRRLLEGLGLAGPSWSVPPVTVGEGSAVLEAARSLRLEGIIAKRLDSPYEPGRRSGAWLKLKLILSQEFVIGGYQRGRGGLAGSLGSLLLGVYSAAGGELVYAGKVGTGFTDWLRAELKRRLDALAQPSSPFAKGNVPRDAIFVQPRLVAEVEFTEWTGEGILRHPSFKGLRDDKSPEQIVREEAPAL